MTEYEILEYAVKGLRCEIETLEKDISKGKQFLKEYENGIKPKTPKTPQEIQQIIQKKKEEIETLDKKRFELEWKMSEI